MSQLNVNVVAPLGYTGPDLTGDSNFVEIIDKNGNTAMEITETETTVVGPLKVDSILPNTGTVVDVNGVPISAPNLNDILIGDQTGINVTTGQGNIAIGTEALSLNTEAPWNIAIGTQALKNTSDPLSDSNVAIGHQSLINNQSGNSNTAVGSGSLTQTTNSNLNTAIGNSSGPVLTLGFNNVFLGYLAGPAFNTGNENIFIGSRAGGNFGAPPNTYQQSGNNNIHIGYSTKPASNTASNAITLGNSSHTVIRAAVTTITSLSDARDKKEIEELPIGLDFVKGLKPVKFIWDDRDEEGKHDVKDFGFIAQDLKKSQEDAELAETLKLVYEENPDKLEASYGKLVPILVKAIQELTAKVEALEAK